jgi:hypothetical protein
MTIAATIVERTGDLGGRHLSDGECMRALLQYRAPRGASRDRDRDIVACLLLPFGTSDHGHPSACAHAFVEP